VETLCVSNGIKVVPINLFLQSICD